MSSQPDMRRREELLDQIEALIRAEGFAQLRVGALAAHLHCSRSTLYRLAPSKDELVELVFERYVDRAIDRAKAEAEKLHSPPERIVRFTEIVAEEQARGSATFWRDVMNDPLVNEVLSETRVRGNRMLKGYLDEGIEIGVFRPANTAFVAHLIWVCAREARDPEVLRRYNSTTDEATEEIGRIIAYGMGTGSVSSGTGAKAS